jgi:hypothetical protein
MRAKNMYKSTQKTTLKEEEQNKNNPADLIYNFGHGMLHRTEGKTRAQARRASASSSYFPLNG